MIYISLNKLCKYENVFAYVQPNIMDTHKEMAQIHSRYYYPITIGKRTSLEPYTFNMGKRSDTTQLYGNKRRESEKFNQIQNFDSHYQQMSRPRFEHERQIYQRTKNCPQSTKNKHEQVTKIIVTSMCSFCIK